MQLSIFHKTPAVLHNKLYNNSDFILLSLGDVIKWSRRIYTIKFQTAYMVLITALFSSIIQERNGKHLSSCGVETMYWNFSRYTVTGIKSELEYYITSEYFENSNLLNPMVLVFMPINVCRVGKPSQQLMRVRLRE